MHTENIVICFNYKQCMITSIVKPRTYEVKIKKDCNKYSMFSDISIKYKHEISLQHNINSV